MLYRKHDGSIIVINKNDFTNDINYFKKIINIYNLNSLNNDSSSSSSNLETTEFNFEKNNQLSTGYSNKLINKLL